MTSKEELLAPIDPSKTVTRTLVGAIADYRDGAEHFSVPPSKLLELIIQSVSMLEDRVVDLERMQGEH